jgi:hypothetical protein
MLVARRDPLPSDAHEVAYGQDPAGSPRLARTVGMLQVVGSLLAIPVGLASAYSIYRANFSVETTCQALRANIISMIDERVDAGTRRMLARRDVEKFEQTCGAIDPDATAAFKHLLAGDKPVTPAAAPASQRAAAPAQEPAHKAEPRPQMVAKQPPAELPPTSWPTAASERARHDANVSDTQWLDAVRQALVTHEANRPVTEADKAPVAPAAPPPRRPVQREAVAPISAPPVAAPAPVTAPPVAAPVPVVAPTMVPAAPALPPAATVAAPPAPAAEGDHPVPPAAIPSPEQLATMKSPEHRSLVGRWISRVPLLGPVWENGRN